jgi:thiol-disulfide isomerase/thioredoxin
MLPATAILLMSLLNGASPTPLTIGEKLPETSSLVATTGKSVSFADFQQDLLVIIVTCNECPVARAYEPRFIDFARKYGGDGGRVGVVAINPYDREGDTLEDMKARSADSAFPFPYAQDRKAELTKRLGAQKTPHLFVFGKDRTLLYHGAFDDSWVNPEAVKRHYLVEVVEAIAAGTKVPDPTKPEGCPLHLR